MEKKIPHCTKQVPLLPSKITNNIESMICLTFPWEAGAENRHRAEATVAGNSRDYMFTLIYFIDWSLPINIMVDQWHLC